MPEFAAPELNPAQAEVLDLLRVPPEERPSFDAGLRHELRAELDHRLRPLTDDLTALGHHTAKALFVNKHTLARVHGCETGYLAGEEEGWTGWSVPSARGTVAHKAIELALNWQGNPPPGTLVDEAIARLTDGDAGMGDWLGTLGAAERAELRSDAVDRVAKFRECFPPLKAAWTPVPESRLRAEALGGTVILSGKVDLTLGKAEGTTAGKVLIDLKSGGANATHLDDLRFYALLETLRLGVPPRMVASYYLESGTLRPEAVTEGVLDAALARAADAVQKVVALRTAQRIPNLVAGPACRWCVALEGCETGRSHLDGDGQD